MNIELEKLIDLAIADGILTDKKKQVLEKKRQELGVDLDEFEMVIEGKLHQIAQGHKQVVFPASPLEKESTIDYRKRPLWPKIAIGVIVVFLIFKGCSGMFTSYL